MCVVREEVRPGEPQRRDDGRRNASGVAMEQQATVVPDGDAQAWVMVVMGRAEGYPPVSDATHALEALQDRRGGHSRARHGANASFWPSGHSRPVAWEMIWQSPQSGKCRARR